MYLHNHVCFIQDIINAIMELLVIMVVMMISNQCANSSKVPP